MPLNYLLVSFFAFLMLYNKTIVDYRGFGYDVISTKEYQYSPRLILVFSGRYHIISNASIVNNCIIYVVFFSFFCGIKGGEFSLF